MNFNINNYYFKEVISVNFSVHKKLKFFIFIIIILILSTTVVMASILKSGLQSDAYTVLKKGTSINKINVKGQIESDSTTEVYTTSSNIIKEIKVKTGDEAKQGDVLALLDTKDLQKEIEQMEASLKTTQATNKSKLDNAKKAYDNAEKLSREGANSQIAAAEGAVNAAKLDLDDKKNTYEDNKVLFQCGAISEQDLNKSEISFKNAQDVYSESLVTLNNIKDKVILDLNTAKSYYEQAKSLYEDKSQQIALERKKQQLSDCTVSAPVNGIVSSINGVEGNPASGSLLQIQSTDNIVAILEVKEADIGKVKSGQKVEVKTDSTGDKIIQGEIIKIEDMAKEEDNDMLKLKDDSNDEEAKFEVKIKIKDLNYKLKIGMKATADIILEEKNNVYKVPYESIFKDKNDNNCIYIAEKQNKGYLVKQVSVTKGTESDSYVEVTGNYIKDGIIVLNNPLDYEVGETIKIK